MTVKELRAQIRQETMDINRRLISYYEDGKRTKILDREIDYLKSITGTAEGKTYISMNTHRKNKAALSAQLSQLRQFKEWDIYTPEAKRIKAESRRNAYAAYKRHTGSRIHFKTFNRAITIAGSINQKMFDIYQIMDMVTVALSKKKDPKEIVKAFEKVVKQNKKKGKTPDDYVDDWYKIMKI